ncbi:MAG: class II aldolase/adducin family protein [Chloroflexi bacterium]|nr:class II aldolase/adducin family protein [Chloroflexota bacterium]
MWESERKEVLQAAQRMAEKGFTVGSSGNVSLRIKESGGRELVAITPSGRYYDSMKADDIVIVDFEGQRVEGELAPSIETMLHIGIYKARKKVNAVIHTHPVFGSVIAVTGMEIPPILDDQVTQIGGEIKVAQYALSGSPEMVKNVIAALGPRNAVLMANHGALSVGRNMQEAFTICELLERTAGIYISALGLGKVNLLPADMAEAGKAFFTAIYGESP